MEDLNMNTPPRELVQQWFNEAWSDRLPIDLHIATRSAQWGHDQANHGIERKLQEARDEELEACCEVVSHWYGDWVNLPIILRTARRPKPPSLKEQALNALSDLIDGASAEYVRRALEQLPDD